jgi:cytochrome c5
MKLLALRSLTGLGCTYGLIVLLHGTLYGQGGASNLPEGEGKEVVVSACTQCHSLNSTLLLRNGREGWKKVVDRMVTNGMHVTPEEVSTILQYLATHLGPGRNPIRTASPGQPETPFTLPPGNGKDIVQGRCSLCHDLGWIASARKNRQEWEAVVRDMSERGPQATPDQIQTIVDYLTANFGK